jgi:hypothetical protein
MNATPRWFWPVALVPALVTAILGITVLQEHHVAHGFGLFARRESVGMALSMYAGVVFLAYLLVLCGRMQDGARRPISEDAEAGGE